MENNTESNIEEKKYKGKVAKIIFLGIIVLLVGIVSGFYLLKGMNKGVKQNTFMYDVLKGSGLLINNESDDEGSNDNDYNLSTDSDSFDFNKLVFIQEKEGCKYYYYLTEEGDYLYYYSYGDYDYFYYASDSDGNMKSQTYKDYVAPTIIKVPNFTKISFENLTYCEDGCGEDPGNGLYKDINLNIIFEKNPNYRDGEIYYQSVKATEEYQVGSSDPITLIINMDKPESDD